MTLDCLKKNQSGEIHEIKDLGLETQLIRMGFLIGETVKIERIAPLNDPILISSNNNTICIRKDDARYIVLQNIQN